MGLQGRAVSPRFRHDVSRPPDLGKTAMPYAVPGRADELGEELVRHWNDTISAAYESQPASLKSRFFELDPEQLREPQQTDEVKWPGDPAEPSFCIDDQTAQLLSDWGKEGRHELHNEYCEYAVVSRRDGTGRLRPKRVEVTTELREYWSCVAIRDPDRVRAMAAETLGRELAWEELFGVPDPHGLSEGDREVAFGHAVAGHGNDERLKAAGVPAQPTGALNTENALFMTHPINGLDDLLYIVLFGAKPYAIREDGEFRQASRDDIFAAFGVEQLACRHADPAAALAAYGAAFAGKQVAFANPLGMYLREPNLEVFSYQGGSVPQDWVRFGRGQEGIYQRLVFGPADEDEAFLDDITVAVGAAEKPLVGGYQLLQQLEIGPLVMVGEGEPVADSEWEVIQRISEPIACNAATVCEGIRELKRRYDAQDRGRAAPRTMTAV